MLNKIMRPAAQSVSSGALGEIDLWSLDLLEEGRELPCGNVRTLLYYLCSPGTQEIHYSETDSSNHTARIKVVGPICDDGTVAYVSYHLSGGEYAAYSREEKAAFADALERHRGCFSWLLRKALEG